MTTSPQSMSDTQALLLAAKECDGVADTVEGNKYCGAKTENFASMDARIATLRNAAKVCRATAEQAGKVEGDYQQIAHLIGSIFFYGGFKAETYNERELESLLRKVGCFYETEAALLAKPTHPAATGLPGMWEAADFTGGDPDERSHSERAATQQPVAWQYRVDVHRDGNWSDWRPCTENFHDEIIEFGECVEGDDPRGVIADARTLYAAPVSPSREVEALRRCLGFFASVIKSGEPWTGTCEREYRAALDVPVQEKAP